MAYFCRAGPDGRRPTAQHHPISLVFQMPICGPASPGAQAAPALTRERLWTAAADGPAAVVGRVSATLGGIAPCIQERCSERLKALEHVYGVLREAGSSDTLGADLYPFARFCRLAGFEQVWDFENRWPEL
jgi:hypothetical protein